MNQNLVGTESEDKKLFLTKEEIVELTGLSIHTINNWLKEEKPLEEELQVGKQNRRAYSIDYLVRLFEKIKKPELISLVKDEERLAELSQEASQEELGLSEGASQGLLQANQSLTETVAFLKSQIETKDKQIESLRSLLEQQQTLMRNEQTLRLQQTQVLLEDKKGKNRGLLGWFGINNQKEEKES
jgi:hypothetical protein